MSRFRYVVGLARCWQEYGGHEEGGWYYEVGQPVGRSWSFFNHEKAMAFRDRLRAGIQAQGAFKGVGIGGAGDSYDSNPGEYAGNEGLDAVIQWYTPDSRGGLQPWPEVRPHYE